MSEQQTQVQECGSVSPLTNVPCSKPKGHNPNEGHGATVQMPDYEDGTPGRINEMTWGAKRQ